MPWEDSKIGKIYFHRIPQKIIVKGSESYGIITLLVRTEGENERPSVKLEQKNMGGKRKMTIRDIISLLDAEIIFGRRPGTLR